MTQQEPEGSSKRSPRERALSEHGEECRVCGSTDEVEVHHVDGDPTNNQIENLLPVCRSCHGKIHAGNVEKWSEQILPRDERNRRVTYTMEPQTQKNIELIMHLTGVGSEKQAIQHAVEEYTKIYDTLQESQTELPSELIETRQSGTLKLSKSFEGVLEQHIESSELVEEIRRDMAEVVAEHLFDSQIPIPEE